MSTNTGITVAGGPCGCVDRTRVCSYHGIILRHCHCPDALPPDDPRRLRWETERRDRLEAITHVRS